MAPEIIDQSYDEKCDIWAVGIIAYQLFSLGEFPFDGPGEISIYKEIKRSKLFLPPSKNDKSYSPKLRKEEQTKFDWETMMSEEAKDFIRLLLTRNP
jgi:calcium-dependent protein kinase